MSEIAAVLLQKTGKCNMEYRGGWHLQSQTLKNITYYRRLLWLSVKHRTTLQSRKIDNRVYNTRQGREDGNYFVCYTTEYCVINTKL